MNSKVVLSVSNDEDRNLNFRPLAMLVGCAFFMEQLDSTIIAPAIPVMAAAFKVEPLQLNLAMTLYLLLLVIFVPVSGALADRFGTRRIFCIAIGIFTISSLACGFAQDMPTLLLARSIQGIGAALMVPVGRIAMVRSTRPADLVAAMAWMVTPAMIGPLLGPPLGGLVVTWLTWPWIFWANVPIGIWGLYLAQRLVPQLATKEKKPIDLAGWLILSIGVGCLVIGLELSHGTSPHRNLATILLTIATLCAYGYWQYSKKHPRPLLDFSLTQITTFRVSLVAGSLVRVGYGALPFLIPLTLQLGMGMSPMDSGIVLAGSALASMVMKATTVKILKRYGFRGVLISNGILCSVGLMACAALNPHWSMPATLCLLLISGVSRSIQFNALGSIAYADTRSDQTGSATSLNTTFQQLAAAIGIALSVWFLDLFSTVGGNASPTMSSYAWTFIMLGLITGLAIPVCFQLTKVSGAALSGR